METMNLWDFEIWDFLVQMGILLCILLIANTIRRKVPFVRRSLLPTSVIAGILLLVLKEVGAFFGFLNEDTMEAVTYHALGLGFICIAMKSGDKANSAQRRRDVVDSGALTVSGYLLQGVLGLGVTILLGYTLMPDLLKAAGLLLPMGYGQGSGQALNFGKIYAKEYGFTGGAAFGLTIAAVGFIWACIGGVIYLNIMRKKGKFKPVADEKRTYVSEEEIAAPNEIPLTESVDKFTIQIAIVMLVYFLTFLLMQGVSVMCDKNWLGNFGINTVKPMIWGFNFLIGTLLAVFVKWVMKKLRKANIMTRDYPSNFLLNRMGGMFFDVMIVAGIAAIKLEDLRQLWIPLAAMCILGGFATMFYVDWVCKKRFGKYHLEQSVAFFGMLLGTASTGMILLREVDPNFKTPAANNLVMQSVPAICFGFPLMLLMGFAPKGDWQTWVTFGVMIVFFLALNALIFRDRFKKRGRLVANGGPEEECSADGEAAPPDGNAETAPGASPAPSDVASASSSASVTMSGSASSSSDSISMSESDNQS